MTRRVDSPPLWLAPRLAFLSLASVAVASLASLSCLGCADDQRNPAPVGSTASTAAGIIAPKGPYPRGQADPRRSPDPATVGPVISVTSPERAAQLTGTSVTVRLQAHDPDGVTAVTVGGAVATALGGGKWTADVGGLVQGMNVIALTAEDGLGNVSQGFLPVVQGTFEAPDTLAAHSLAVSLSPAGLLRVAAVAEQAAQNVDLFALVSQHNPLHSSAVIEVSATSLTHDPLQIALEGAPTGLLGTVAIDAVSFGAQVHVIGAALAPATLTATRATAVIEARVDQRLFTGSSPGNRALGLEIERIDVSLDGFKVQTGSGALTLILAPFKGLLERVVANELEKVLLDTVGKLLGGSLSAVNAPLVIGLPASVAPVGTSAVGEVELSFEVHRAWGTRVTGLDLEGGVLVGTRGPGLPGATRQVFSDGVLASPPQPGPEAFAVAVAPDGLNRLFHGLWATGALQLTVDGTSPSPGATMALQAGLLYPFLPPVRALAPDPATPVVIELSVAAPPLLRVTNGSAPIEATAPDVRIVISIDYMDGGPRLELCTISASLEAAAGIAVGTRDVEITGLTIKHLRIDVLREPAADLEDQQLEDFVDQVAPQLLATFTGQLPRIPIPALPLGLKLSNASIRVEAGALVVRGDL